MKQYGCPIPALPATGAGSRITIIQPSNPLLSDSKDQVVTIWRVDDLDGLLTRTCERLHWHLTYSRNVTNEDRAMCGIQVEE